MQKVERRKHREKRPGRLAWILLCAVLLAAGVTAGLILHRTAEKAELPAVYRREPVTGFIIQRDADEVESITVTQHGKAPWTVVQQESGTLRLKTEEGSVADNWLVDSHIAKILIDVASNLAFKDVYTENREEWEPEAEAFGLADPKIIAEVCFTDGTKVTVRVGNTSDAVDSDSYYMTVDGNDWLYALDAGTVEDLNTEMELLHPVPDLDIRSSLLDRITVKDGNGTVLTEWMLQGNIRDQDAAENWLLTAPFAYPADYDQIENLKQNAENLLLGVYVGEADAKTLKRCGLDKPSAVIELHMAAGTTGTVGAAGVYDVEECEERTEILTIGSSKSDMSAYVLYGNEVFTISYYSVNVFIKAKPMNSAARYVVITPLSSVESVTVEKQDAETVRYTVTKNAVSEESLSDENGGYTCTRNGEEIPYTVLSAAWDRLLTVTVSGRLTKDYQPKAVHTRYTVHTVSGTTHTIELSDFDGMHDAVTLDGHTLFYLIKDGMTNLP